MTTIQRISSVAVAAAALTVSPAFAQDGEGPDFVEEVLPILETKCMGCHRAEYEDPRTGRAKKPKSGYLMSTAATLLGGGDENDENIVPGEADESPSYTYTNLPEDDDYFMPPKGDPLTDEEKAILAAWINAGAELGDWEETKFTPEGDKIDE